MPKLTNVIGDNMRVKFQVGFDYAEIITSIYCDVNYLAKLMAFLWTFSLTACMKTLHSYRNVRVKKCKQNEASTQPKNAIKGRCLTAL